MRAIGFKNFRRFENFPTMQLGNITMLVGGNNSGKSTVVKAALLMKRFLSTTTAEMTNFATDVRPVFSFDVPNAHIGTFHRALNRTAKKQSNNYGVIEFEYQEWPFDISVKVSGNTEDTCSSWGDVRYISINDKKELLNYWFDFDNQKMGLEYRNKPTLDSTGWFDSLEEEINYLQNEYIPDLEKKIKECKDLEEIIQLKEELSSESETLSEAKRQLASSPQERAVTIDLATSSLGLNGNYIASLLQAFIDYSELTVSSAINKRSKEYKSIVSGKQIILSCRDRIVSSIDAINKIASSPIEYISAHSARQEVFFKGSDKNDYMAQAIHEFAKARINPGDDEHEFVAEWLEEFGIAKDFRIKNYNGEAYEIRMLYSDSMEEIFGTKNSLSSKKINDKVKLSQEAALWEEGEPLASKGMGAIQITILLLQLATFIRKYRDCDNKPLIMIEEPEQNLHPKMQSLLADLFLDFLKFDLDFKFLIETHSEYLIRKSQVIVAEESIKKETEVFYYLGNPFKVFYFPQNGVPYDMEYQDNGRFKNKFGEGFFDVSSGYNIQLNKLERSIKDKE